MITQKQNKPITVAVVGAGHRSVIYANHALEYPNAMKIVAVADPDAQRRKEFSKLHDIPSQMQFDDYDDLVSRPKFADAVINGTMDGLHYDSTMKLLDAGYDVLLEKPIAPTEWEVRELLAHAQKLGRTILICHVLRYAPFYASIKKIVEKGQIGKIVNLHSAENVSYHHMAVGYIRGKWNKRETSSPILLAKCCHDMDLIAWMMAETKPVRVSSFGSLFQFKPQNAPQGASLRCLDGCRIEAECPYSAKLNFKANRGEIYVWETDNDGIGMTDEEKMHSLRTTNPHGRCVWHCDNNVVDHQNVIVEFANGATASHDLVCGTARPTRKIHIFGTKGEIEGDMLTGIFTIRKPSLDPTREYDEETIDINMTDSIEADHGGGDSRLAADFAAILQSGSTASGLTRIEDSLNGHLITFAAIRAMDEKRIVEIQDYTPARTVEVVA